MTAVQRSRTAKWGRRLLISGGVVGLSYAAADYYTDNSLTRSLRCLYGFAQIAYMYKFTTPETANEYFNLHKTSAKIILNVCLKNEGLYIKMGQALNAMNHVLPKEYMEELKVLLDEAPQVDFPVVRKIIEQETGKTLEDIFERFDETPVASASIAQVHKARLRARPGEVEAPMDVAVKVRKPSIETQGEWDIRTYMLLSFLIEYCFDFPTAWSRKTIVDALRREINFVIEGQNAEHFRRDFSHRDDVYIPQIVSHMTTPKLLTMEWIDATKLKDVDKVKEQFDAGAVLKTLFNAFGDMVFKYAFVHCDPHAANILVRKKTEKTSSGSRKFTSFFKKDKNDFQIVLLDFGLAVPETEKFRVQYALFFKSLFTHDMKSMQSIMKSWGISDAEVFASIQLQKPYSSIKSGNFDEVNKEEIREMQRRAHTRVRTMLIDDAKIPKEITLVGRGIDILRGINRSYGSPINRINMFVESAVEGLGPLHDAETVQLYLDHLQKLKEQKGLPLSKDTYTSVYDEQAALLRDEQMAAVEEMHANKSSMDLFVIRLMTFYRSCMFQWTLCTLNMIHWMSKMYCSIMFYVSPTTAEASANLLEDKVKQMQESMRVQ